MSITSTCPMCGGHVKVHTSDEGTGFYQPVDVGRLIESLDSFVKWTEKYLSSHEDIVDWPTKRAELLTVLEEVRGTEKSGKI